MRYRILVVVEQGEHNCSAYAPDLPGVVSTGKTVEETVQNMREALDFHLESMARDGDPVPEIYTVAAEFVEVEIPDKVPTAH
jgi:predicted RNase H-like HicB family nuclease